MPPQDLALCCVAVLVDNDGVLVDSAASIKRAFIRWSEKFELNGEDVHRRMNGHRAIEVAKAVLPSGDVAAAAGLLDQYELEDAANVRALPGSAAFLEQLAGRWTMVSSGPQALVQARLEAARLPQPRHFVTADSVAQGKPNPDSYLLAASLNEADPADCVAFEDSRAGLQSAIRAGCQVIQVGDGSPRIRSIPRIPNLGVVAIKRTKDRLLLSIRTETA